MYIEGSFGFIHHELELHLLYLRADAVTEQRKVVHLSKTSEPRSDL